MHYLVTGGCGFIGAHLVRRLLEDGHAVTVIDDLSNAKTGNIPAAATLIVQDITAPKALDTLVAKGDGVFHLAAVVSVVRSTQEWLATHRITLGGTVALLDAMARLKRPLPVVYASSAAVYGDSVDTPFKETSPCAPISAYGADKLACELHARVGSLVHGIPSLGLRFFNVYGAGQDPASPYAGVISIFMQHMQQGKPITIYGDGEQVRDYIHVSDVVASMQAAMGKLQDRTLSQGVFNVCTGTPVSVNGLVQTLSAVTGSRPDIQHATARPGDILRSLGNPSLAKQILGFSAQTALQDGLELTLEML